MGCFLRGRGSVTLCGLLKTGQITSYVDYDDGYYEKGIAKEYEILTTGQYAGVTAITINGKTDNHSNNVVKDLKTGLEWSRYVSGSVGPLSNGKLPWTTTGSGATAEGIYPYVAAANLALLGGYGDWRISNPGELMSIANLETYSGPDSIAFPSYPSGYIWSSGTSKPTTTGAMAYYTTGDYVLIYLTKTENSYCHLVRGG